MQLDAAIIRQENTLKCFIMKLRFNNLCHRQSNHVSYDMRPNKCNSKKEIFFEKLATDANQTSAYGSGYNTRKNIPEEGLAPYPSYPVQPYI